MPIHGAGCARPRLAVVGSTLLLSGGRMCVTADKAEEKALFLWTASALRPPSHNGTAGEGGQATRESQCHAAPPWLFCPY